MEFPMERQKEWFTSWFDSPYYHMLYDYRDGDEAQQFLEHLLDHLGHPTRARILDVGCGKGRFSRLLAKRGHCVTGIDIASQNIESAGNYTRDNLSFLRHDMREPFLFSEEPFDFVFNFFTSFGYFETWAEHQKTIQNIADCLKYEGQFIVDFLNIHKIQRNITPEERIKKGNTHFHIQRRIEENKIIKKVVVCPQGDPSMEFVEKVRMLSLSDFKELLSQSSLQVKNVFGDYSLSPFHPLESDRLIIETIKV
jgi:2-polyprenyl-3-methyl-5-hydroxy-6-metoxy-1,4-benzoquinol methylase